MLYPGLMYSFMGQSKEMKEVKVLIQMPVNTNFDVWFKSATKKQKKKKKKKNKNKTK